METRFTETRFMATSTQVPSARVRESRVFTRFADVEIDAEAHEPRRSGDLIDVQPQVLSVLLFLIDQRERVVSKEELLDAVWDHRFVTESALTSRIESARQALGDNGRDQRRSHDPRAGLPVRRGVDDRRLG